MTSRIAVIAVISMFIASCGVFAAAPPPFIDLDERVDLPAEGIGEVAPLRIAVAAILSPEGNIESYGALADYLGAELHRPVEIVQRRTYHETHDLLAARAVGIGFVCTCA